MIIGIGIDLVKISRIEQDLMRFGERFAERILTDAEMDVWRHHDPTPIFLAGRFAAKEAAVKALGTGFRGGISLKTICVLNDALGRPQLTFSSEAAAHAMRLGAAHYHVSLSHEREFAVALVILEK